MVTTGHWLDHRRIKKDKTFPIKIRITYERQNRFVDSGYSANEEDYERICKGKQLPRRLDSVYKDLNKQVTRAGEVGNGLKTFSWDQFKKKYYKSQSAQPGNLIYVLSEYERILRLEGRIGSADTYKSTIQSLVNYLQDRGTKDPFSLGFDSCTVDFLKNYQRWLTTPRKGKKAKTLTSVGYHMRNIRRGWNIGIRKYEVNSDTYPFGVDKYAIPHPIGNKRFLGEHDLNKIFSYTPEDDREEFYYDMWILSFLLAGINMRDLCQLKYRNIIVQDSEEGEQFKMIKYTRAKTARTRKDSGEIRIPLEGANRTAVERVIRKWWNGEDGKPDDYVLPILKKRLDPERITALVKQFTKMVNKNMATIAGNLKLNSKPTTYVARHSFASMMLIKGYGSDMIRTLLGHSTVQTTETYLAGFPDEVVGKAMESIIPDNS